MRRLVPPAIHEIALSEEPTGSIDGCVVAFDIVGSTSIASDMAASGTDGAARFADLLDATFDPIVRGVDRLGGFVAHFAGDGAIGVLPGRDATDGARLRETIVGAIRARGGAPVRSGSAAGRIDWRVWSTEHRRLVVWSGGPIDEATGEATTLEVPPSPLTESLLPPPGGLSEADQRAAALLPGILWDLRARGEFRRVVSCFVRIGPHPTDDEIRAVLDLSHDFRGYLKDAEFTHEEPPSLGFTLFWGAPTARENDADRALEFLDALRSTVAVERLRAGVSDGSVFAGFVGGPAQSAYACLGAPVHLAARLASVAEPGVVLTDEETARAARMHAFRPGGLVNVHGFEAPVVVQQMTTGTPTASTEVVGRDAELDALARALLADEPATALIVGEGGSGKTALVAALADRLGQRATFVTVEADRVRSRPLGMWRAIARNALGISRDLQPRRRHRRFEAAMRVLHRNAPHLEEELDRSRSALAAMTDVGRDLWSELPLAERIEAAVGAVDALASAIAAGGRRLVLTFEDVGWADQPSAHVLRTFLTRRTDPGVAVLLTSREPSDLPATTTITLEPLDDGSISTIAAAHLDGDDSIGVVVERAGGNPYFARQLARWIASTGSGETLPGDIVGLLTAQIDRLPATRRQVVQTAALLGRTFDANVLGWMTGGDPTEAIADGADRGIWRAGADRVTFSNDLVREAAASMPLPDERRRIHGAAATGIMAIHPGRGDLAADVAAHLLAAGRSAEASPHLLRAGLHAAANFGNEEALAHLSDSADLATDPADRRRALVAAIGVADTIAARDRQAALVARLEALATNDEDAGAEALHHRVTLHMGLGEWDEARRRLDAWSGAWSGDLHTLRAFVERHAGDLEGARHHAALARTAYRESGDRHGIALTTDLEGGIEWDAGRIAEATALHRRAVGLFAGIDAAVGELGALNNLGTALWAAGDLAAARTAHARAVERSREVGLRIKEGDSIDGLGGIAWTIGDDDEALRHYRDALRLRRRIADEWGISISLSNLGIAHRRLGRLVESLDDYTEALEVARRIGRTRGVAYALTGMGVTLDRLGRHADAIDALTEAESLRVGLGDTGLLPETRAHLAAARAAATLDPTVPADEALAGGPGRFDAAEDAAEAALALRSVLVDLGRADDAAAVVAEAARHLRERAARAGSEEMARRMLTDVAANARVIALAP